MLPHAFLLLVKFRYHCQLAPAAQQEWLQEQAVASPGCTTSTDGDQTTGRASACL